MTKLRLIFVALLFTMFGSTSALALTDAEFCSISEKYSQIANKDVGKMLDQITRNDGMWVLCNLKIVDFKKFLLINESAMRQGWKERKQKQWVDSTCGYDAWREAAKAGWTISMTLILQSGERYRFVLEC